MFFTHTNAQPHSRMWQAPHLESTPASLDRNLALTIAFEEGGIVSEDGSFVPFDVLIQQFPIPCETSRFLGVRCQRIHLLISNRGAQ